ncbi:hypothetical protein HK100_001392 [Physocladia obscura]|uniref:Uncharacterized protein n=1 Tax=Physocladia obscura TaxID=109957 RepID=A0AAD5T8E4_9FUNG|nr:hypothetical protein HK100_001392 [Physocladia obscura]
MFQGNKKKKKNWTWCRSGETTPDVSVQLYLAHEKTSKRQVFEDARGRGHGRLEGHVAGVNRLGEALVLVVALLLRVGEVGGGAAVFADNVVVVGREERVAREGQRPGAAVLGVLGRTAPTAHAAQHADRRHNHHGRHRRADDGPDCHAARACLGPRRRRGRRVVCIRCRGRGSSRRGRAARRRRRCHGWRRRGSKEATHIRQGCHKRALGCGCGKQLTLAHGRIAGFVRRERKEAAANALLPLARWATVRRQNARQVGKRSPRVLAACRKTARHPGERRE